MSAPVDVRPNYYRVRCRARAIEKDVAVASARALTMVEIEAQDLIEALGGDFNVGNALKYLFRAGKKSPTAVDDLRKASVYLSFAVTALERGAK